MTVHFVHLLDELQRRSLRMASAVEDMVQEACDAVARVDHDLARRIIARDADIDSEEVAVEGEALRLMTLFQPMGADMRQLCAILKINNDLERVADCAVNMAERARHLDADVLAEARNELIAIFPAMRRMLHEAVRAYAGNDEPLADRVRAEDEVIDTFYGDFIRNIAALAHQTPEQMNALLDYLSIAKNLERIADHASNIAEDVIFLSTGRIVRHQDK